VVFLNLNSQVPE